MHEHTRGNSRLSLWSEDSLLSIGSRGSVLSIGSVGSFASIGSIGSFCSAFSIGSALSVSAALISPFVALLLLVLMNAGGRAFCESLKPA